LAFPQTISIEALKAKHAGYEAEKMQLHGAMYAGGEAFSAIKPRLLVHRKTDTTLNLRSERLELAPYVNRSGGLIDWLIAAVLKDTPRLEVEGDSDAEYWESLNTNADGNGSDLVQVAQSVLLSVLVNNRGYFGITFPGEEVDRGRSESMDLRMSCLSAWVVEDWQESAYGSIQMIRTHGVEYVRPSEWEQPENERHLWTFYTPSDVYVYQAEKPIRDEFKKDAVASLVLERSHGLDLVPVFPARPAPGQWVMDRIYEVAKALFNADAQTCWHLDKSAYAQPVLKSVRNIKNVVASEVGCLQLDPGDSYDYSAPPSTIYQSLSANAEYLKRSLYEVMQALAINAMATQTQNARQSAAAKEIDRDPLDVYLGSLALVLRNALESWIDAVKMIRGEEDVEIKIVGLADYSRAKMSDIMETIGLDISGDASYEDDEQDEMGTEGEGNG